jgi:hypothetical protein
MQVQCTKCSQPIALTDIIESHNGHLSHVDCKRPHVLTPEERALVFVYCSGHVVARCPACDISFRYNELAADILAGGRTHVPSVSSGPHRERSAATSTAARCCRPRCDTARGRCGRPRNAW